ncbi:hypothetical protein HG531_007841 [Fusarium graminearum]|nr:hypothetical protein HG531_007841 [Fusarium graminearum]
MLGKESKSLLRFSSSLKNCSSNNLNRCVVGGRRHKLLDRLDCGIGLAQVQLSKSTKSLELGLGFTLHFVEDIFSLAKSQSSSED